MLYTFVFTFILLLVRLTLCWNIAMPSIFIPLYVYPHPGEWDFLYSLAERHTEFDFTVVINPNSGPGPDPLPDANYVREITKFSTYDNIKPLGYVATTYATKNIGEVESEIATYANWSKLNPSLTLNGIFFDETPWLYDAGNVSFLSTIANTVRTIGGWASNSSVVVHNPGCIPDANYLQIADITVVLETNYTTFVTNNLQKSLLALPYDKDRLCVLLHSVPPDLADTKSLVNGLRQLANHIWVSDCSMDYYSCPDNYTNGRFEELVLSDLDILTLTDVKKAAKGTSGKFTIQPGDTVTSDSLGFIEQ